MTSEPQSWLPHTALFDGRLSEEVGRQVQAWSKRWIATQKPPSVRTTAGNVMLSASASAWESDCKGILISCDIAMPERFGAAMLGFQSAPRQADVRDRKLLRALADRAIKDLLVHLGDLFLTSRITHASAPRRLPKGRLPSAIRFPVALGVAGCSFEIHVSAGAAASGRKSLTSPPRPPKALGTRNKAIGQQVVTIAARAGAGVIDLAELPSIAPGDVLVLDRSVADGLELTLDGVARPDVDIRLEQDSSALTLRIDSKYKDVVQ